MSDSRLFDPALQPERTQLAWRRTALSIAIGSIAAVRILPEVLGGPLWYAPGIVGVLFAGYLWAAAHARHAAHNRWLIDEVGVAPGGRSLVALSAFTVGAGVVAAAAVVIVSLR